MDNFLVNAYIEHIFILLSFTSHFLDRCDEIGLLVFEEIPGWQHIGGEAWKEQAVRDVEDMIIRDRNHPSIVIWGVRINESQDDYDLYTRTNELARKLDPTRATGGVRYIVGSELLEAVYTINDFVHDGGHKKYLAKEMR
ncbi:glycoside hydrolase family 2 TIM barrel-domain containing protein [Paenibacillus polymyxa]|uniref:glycoside hydrolase family 2 TIM barrel-domain containing protein n=1 Tax=Paenibacillus polymyxa TaxID=1406 RepID=UPI00139239D6|nr:glycoside hydrolase family 2 TIM barrel-domain containing protein [Paenibacillus polymyxa]